MITARSTQFFTFYSFKGGVGRSMALINTAAQLARRGRRVLAIDLDLEAPGISYLSAERGVADTPGFVDAIFQLLHSPEESPFITGKPEDAVNRFIRPLNLKTLAQGADAGVISIMPAGRLNEVGDYQHRLTDIDFARLYREGVGVRVLQHFKKVIIDSQQFDYVLVDSRTGLSTEAGIAVRDLADHLIVVMGLNHQNVTGTIDFLKVIRSGEPRPETVTAVLSPMPLGEDDLSGERIRTAERSLRNAWPEALQKPLADLQIPYHPRLALEENPHIARLTTRPLTQAYAQLERHIRTIAHDTPDDYLQEAQKLIRERHWADAIPSLRELIRFEHSSARLILQQVLRENSGERAFDAYAEMLKSFAGGSYEAASAACLHFANSGRMGRGERVMRLFLASNRTSSAAWIELATLWVRKAKRFDRADRIFSEALAFLPQNGDLHVSYSIFLWHACGDAARAEPHYLAALRLAPENATALDNYALFLWTAYGRISEADEYFRKALRLESDMGNGHSNYAELLLAQLKIPQAELHLNIAWTVREGEHPFVSLETLFRAALLCLLSGRSDTVFLRQIASKLDRKFEGEFVTFERLLNVVEPHLSAENTDLYRTLGGVLGRKARPSVLRKFQRWPSRKPLAFQDSLFESGNIVSH